jgi:hypothetical protein
MLCPALKPLGAGLAAMAMTHALYPLPEPSAAPTGGKGDGFIFEK